MELSTYEIIGIKGSLCKSLVLDHCNYCVMLCYTSIFLFKNLYNIISFKKRIIISLRRKLNVLALKRECQLLLAQRSVWKCAMVSLPCLHSEQMNTETFVVIMIQMRIWDVIVCVKLLQAQMVHADIADIVVTICTELDKVQEI